MGKLWTVVPYLEDCCFLQLCCICGLTFTTSSLYQAGNSLYHEKNSNKAKLWLIL